MRSTERFVQMTGLLLALIGSLALCWGGYASVTNKFDRALAIHCVGYSVSHDGIAKSSCPNDSLAAQLPD